MHSQEQLRGDDELRRVGSSWWGWLGEPQPWWHHGDDKNLERNENVQHFAIATVGLR
jgi:hypothetical protein